MPTPSIVICIAVSGVAIAGIIELFQFALDKIDEHDKRLNSIDEKIGDAVAACVIARSEGDEFAAERFAEEAGRLAKLHMSEQEKFKARWGL